MNGTQIASHRWGSNLIGNSVKHGDRREAIQVRLDGTQEEVVTLSVINAGVIPPTLLTSIFDPFRGGERQAGRSEGLGLGLYIVQQIVHAHQGSIDVQSGEANRTMFCVKVPRRAR